MADVFISYSRQDGAFVRDLHERLTGMGRDAWVDWADIPPASRWRQEVVDSIDAAESFVFVVSPSSLESENCVAELQHAEKQNKRIVPIAVDGARAEDAPTGLRELNWIWWRKADDAEKAFSALADALETDLRWSKAHTRLLVRAVEWDARQDVSLLLRGKDLAEAVQTIVANAGKEPRPTELQQRYLDASRRAATRRQRALLGGVSTALAVAVALGVLALLQRNDARRATRAATSVALASAAADRVASRPDRALLLALAAYRSRPSPQARDAAVTALQVAHRQGVAAFLRGGVEVRAVAFALDGTIATGGEDGAVQLWHLEDEDTKVDELGGTGATAVVGLGFANDGRTLAVGHADGYVEVWDVEKRRTKGSTLSAGGPIAAIAVSPDASALAVAHSRGSVVLWQLRSGVRRQLSGPVGDEVALAIDPGGQTLAEATTASDRGRDVGAVRVWDIPSGHELGDLPLDGAVNAVAFAADGTLITGGSVESTGRGVVQRWKVRPLAALQRLEAPDSVRSLDVTGRRRLLAVGFANGGIGFATLKWDEWRRTFHGFAYPVTMLAIAPDGDTVVAAVDHADTVRLWYRLAPPPAGRVIASVGNARDVAFSPDGTSVAVADGGGGIRLASTSPDAGDEAPRLPAPSAELVAFNRDGTVLAAMNEDASAELWDPHLRQRSATVRAGSGETAGALAFDPAGEVLAAASYDGTIRLWDVPGRKLLDAPVHVGRDVLAAAFADGGRTLVVVTPTRTELVPVARSADPNTWEQRADATQKPVVTSYTRTTLLPARRSGDRKTLEQPVADVLIASVSGDGRRVALADADGTVWLWELGAARAVALSRGRLAVGGLAFSADGSTLAVARVGGAVQLWDARARRPLGQPLHRQTGNGKPAVAFASDGRALVALDGDTARLREGFLWRDLDDLKEQVCALVVGGLSKEEWSSIAPSLGSRRTCER